MIRPEWIAPARTALLLIDMQVDFGAPQGAMARRDADLTMARAAVENAVALADAARAAGVMPVFVRLITRPGSEGKVLREAKARRDDDQADLCVEGSPGADFIGPKPQPGELIISKSRFSAFAGTGLAAGLSARGLDTVVLAGLTTECCIQSSAWHAFEQDLHVFIVSDACAAYDQALHRHALDGLALSGALLGTTGDFVSFWKMKA
jgi:ureidoacrylate peracid hydrolase